MLDLFRRIQQSRNPAASDSAQPVSDNDSEDKKRTRIFEFHSLQRVISAAEVTASRYNGLSSLYKNEHDGTYLLVLTQGNASRDDFDKICNMLSEYGSLQRSMPARAVFLKEHYESLIADKALQSLDCGKEN